MPGWFVLDDVIEHHRSLPEGSLILGVDPEEKPLVLSLDDPSFGSLLILGDIRECNHKHLLALLESAQRLNKPEILQIDVITPSPERFKSTSSNLRTVIGSREEAVFGLLGDYLSSVEQRMRDRRTLPYQILVLDEIDVLVGGLAEESLRFLRWIMRRGPQVGIWPVATLESGRLANFDRKTYRTFGFRMYGRMSEAEVVTRYTEFSPDELRSLLPGSEGCFKLDGNAIAFSIPVTT